MQPSGLGQAIDGELRLLRPEVRADRSALEELLDDDFVEIGASGRVWTRDAVMADLLTSPALDVEVLDLQARAVDAGVVLVTYLTVSPARRVLRSSWWRSVGETWRCFFHQGTVVPAED